MELRIKPFNTNRWALYFNETQIGISKLNCDCVLAAKRIQAIYDEPPVIVNEVSE